MDKIPIWTKSRTKSPLNGQNPELDKIQNESRIGQNPEWTKSRIGQNPELDKIQNGQNPQNEWTKSQLVTIPNGQNRIGQNPEWTKPRMDKILNRKNPKQAKSRI